MAFRGVTGNLFLFADSLREFKLLLVRKERSHTDQGPPPPPPRN